ncbi:hypothetical protein Tco_0932435 [Tanacetum coccineum]
MLTCFRVPAIFFPPCKPSRSETYVSASVKEIDYVQLGIVNQAELKLQPRAFFSFCTAAYTENDNSEQEKISPQCKDEDAYEHVERVLEIVGLFNIPGVSMDAIMLRVFPVTLTGAAKRYCPPLRTAKQLEDIRNFRQDGNETLYQTWERYNDLLCKCPGHDLNKYQKNWHDEGSLGRSSSDEISTITNKLNDLGRDMRKLKESMHAIQVGCEMCGGMHSKKLPPKTREETIERYLEESSKRQDSFEEWMKRFRESTDRNLKMHDSMIKGVEKKVEQLAQVVHSSMIHHSKFVNHVKMKTFERNETPKSAPKIVSFSNKVKKRIGEEQERTFLDGLVKLPVNTILIDTIRQTLDYTKILKNELPPKEKRLRKFHSSLCLGDPKPIRILIEMAGKSIESPKGIIENVLVPNDFGEQENLEEFLMNKDLNGDLGDLLDVNNLLPENDGDPFRVLSDSESEMGAWICLVEIWKTS